MYAGILASALLAFSSGPLAPANADRLEIVGGKQSEPGAHPSVVAVVVGRQLCAATVVAPKVLVTAAHCFASANAQTRVTAHIGDSIHADRRLVASSWATHPNYCGREDCKDDSYDYAYIRLPEAVELAEYPRPLTQQAQYDQIMQAGQPLLLVGYGEDDAGDLGRKHEATTSILLFTEKGRQFLTAGEGKDSCRGDSGGPALARDPKGGLLWLGVLSSGARECGKGGYYGVPLPMLSWLKQNTGYDPGGCLEEGCLDLIKSSSGGGGTTEPPDSSSCAARIPGPAPWGWSVVLLAGLGRMRRTRSRLR